MSRRISLPFILLAASALLACSSSSSSGTAPTIKDFVLTPTTLTVGQTVEINGSLTIEDVDGDIAGASGEVVQPDGARLPIQDVSFSAGGRTSAPVVYKIPAFPVPKAGQYTVSVVARDGEGNKSAPATVTLTAQ